MIGSSAFPAGSLGKILHQLREQAEGATTVFAAVARGRNWHIATNSNAALAAILRPVLELLRTLHSVRQLFLNAAIAASRVGVARGWAAGFAGCLHDAADHHAVSEHGRSRRRSTRRSGGWQRRALRTSDLRPQLPLVRRARQARSVYIEQQLVRNAVREQNGMAVLPPSRHKPV
jgi:hypothetical protein